MVVTSPKTVKKLPRKNEKLTLYKRTMSVQWLARLFGKKQDIEIDRQTYSNHVSFI